MVLFNILFVFFLLCFEVRLGVMGTYWSKEGSFLKEIIEFNICKGLERSYFREVIIEVERNRNKILFF